MLDECRDAFAPLSRDKGLANYDRNSDMETFLKNMVNLNKDALNYISELTDSLPILGPLLGPGKSSTQLAPLVTHCIHSAVYDIKCMLDDILDFTENLTDGLLNDLRPLLQGVITGYGTYVCGPGGMNIAGLCLNGLLVDLGM